MICRRNRIFGFGAALDGLLAFLACTSSHRISKLALLLGHVGSESLRGVFLRVIACFIGQYLSHIIVVAQVAKVPSHGAGSTKFQVSRQYSLVMTLKYSSRNDNGARLSADSAAAEFID